MTSETPSAFAVFDDFQRTDDFDGKASTLRLPDALWNLCSNLDQPRSARSLAYGLGGDANLLAAALVELEQLGLVQRTRRTWEEYRAAAKAVPEVAPFAVVSETQPPFPMATRSQPPSTAEVSAPTGDGSAPGTASPRVGRVVRVSLRASPGTFTARPTPTPFTDTPSASFKAPAGGDTPTAFAREAEGVAVCSAQDQESSGGSASPVDLSLPGISTPLHCANRGIHASQTRREVPSFAAAALDRGRAIDEPVEATADSYASGDAYTGPRELRPLIDAVIEAGGGGLPGQLLAYRVFLRVPADVVARNGIESITLVQPGHLVEDPEFIQAVDESLRSVAGLCWTRSGVTRI